MKKVLTASNVLACLSFLLSLVFIILFAVNVGSAGYFQGLGAPNFILFVVLVLVFDLLIIALSFLKLGGVVGKIIDILVFLLKIAVPMLLMFAALTLLQTRIEGLGYIFFSNVDVAKEVATPANLASATVAILAVVFGVVAAIASIVGAFFLPKKEEPVVA